MENIITSTMHETAKIDADIDTSNHSSFPGDTVIEAKGGKIARAEWTRKSDGGVFLTFTNIFVRIFHIKTADGTLVTDTICQFDQYNNTQNDKGDHYCWIRILLQDAINGAALAIPYSRIGITRDVCRQLPTTFLPQVRLGTDYYNQIQAIGWDGAAQWNYEGGC